MFRYRWERKDRYTEDLISYLFRPAPQRRHFAEMTAVVEGELMWSRVAARPVLSGGGHVVPTTILAMLASLLENAPPDFADRYAVAK